MKRKIRAELRKWKKGEAEKRYKKMRGEFNKVCERKKKEESKKIARKARTESQIWKVENRERKRKRRINDGIRMEEWVKHFKEQLGGVEERIRIRIRRRREEVKPEITRQVEKAVRKLKKEKAVRGNDISGEVWKYGGKRIREYICVTSRPQDLILFILKRRNLG